MASATDQPPSQASLPTHSTPVDVEKEAIVDDNSRGIKKVLDEKLLKHSHDADAAMKAFEGMEGQVVELTEEKSKALLRKIDMHMMPVSWSSPVLIMIDTFLGYV
jgi:ACS family allantoate permease-like MFS transporter